MPRTSETLEQRRARTAKARATFNSRFSTPEERTAYFKAIVQRREDRRRATQSGAEQNDPSLVPDDPR